MSSMRIDRELHIAFSYDTSWYEVLPQREKLNRTPKLHPSMIVTEVYDILERFTVMNPMTSRVRGLCLRSTATHSP
jgi:hypothetical protein